jgi:hypothetical protein
MKRSSITHGVTYHACADCGQQRMVGTDDQGFLVSSAHQCAADEREEDLLPAARCSVCRCLVPVDVVISHCSDEDIEYYRTHPHHAVHNEHHQLAHRVTDGSCYWCS